MDALIHRLQTKLRDHPENVALTETLAILDALKKVGKPAPENLELVQQKIAELRRSGVWDPTQDGEAALRDLQAALVPKGERKDDASKVTTNHKNGSSVKPSNLSSGYVPVPMSSSPAIPRFPASFSTPTVLPMELYSLLNQAYQLHVLALEPQTILPPGKSLLSIMAQPHSEQHPTSALQGRVEDMVHRAFWDEVRTVD
jgi:hypothetical protein